MAKITIEQTIPCELYNKYKNSMRLATEWKTGSGIYVCRQRQPFRIPTMQGDSLSTPSAEQKAVRAAFVKCVHCYNASPKTGGAVPPDIGYRSRQWWYTDAISSGLWYYDYFIQQSWSTFFANNTPDWCKEEMAGDTIADEEHPGTNYGSAIYVGTRETGAANTMYGYMKTDYAAPQYLHIYIVQAVGITKTIYIYSTGSWNEMTLTWNNKPATGVFISSFVVPLGYTGWKVISVKGYNNIVAIQQTVYGGDTYWASRNHGTAAWHPFWTA